MHLSVSRSADRAVDPGASGERYLDHGLVGDSVLVKVSGVHSPRSHGVGLNGILKAQQVDTAGAGTGLTGMRLVAGAYLQGPDPLGVSGCLPLPCPSTAAQTVQQSGRNVQSPVCALVQSPDMQGDQRIDTPWVHNSSTGSGLSSLPPTPDGGQPGFIAEARGTSHATTDAPLAASVMSTPVSVSVPPAQTSNCHPV